MSTWIDGHFVGEQKLPPRTSFAPFETMGAAHGDLPLWPHHLARLQANAARLGLPFRPDAALQAAARELLRQDDQGDGVLRLLLLPSHDGVHTVLTTRPRSPTKVVQLLPTVVSRPASAPPGDLKAEPRAYYDLVRQQAQDGGADDGLVVDRDGHVLETALGNLWLRFPDGWVTPPLDGRVLPGIARALLLATARQRGVAVHERTVGLGDLHAASALAHSNAVYGPRPARLVGADPTGTPAIVATVDSELGALWRAATSG